MRVRHILLVALLVCCGAAHAERHVIGDWALDVGEGWTEALTANDASSSFGYYCTAGSCSFYLDLNTSCGADGAHTPVLVNAEAGSVQLMATCVNLTVNGAPRHVNMFQNNDIQTAIASGSTIGFAVPIQGGGQFKIVRFSLNGAAAATRGAVATMEQLGKARPAQPHEFRI